MRTDVLSHREENIYPVVSQPYINRTPNEDKCPNESPRPRLTWRRSAVLWRRRLNGDGPLQPGRCVLLTRFRVFLWTSAQRPSASWHIAVLPGAISRLCSVSWRQIPVWATDTPPHLQHGRRSLQRSLRIEPQPVSTISSLKTSHSTWHEASALIKFSYIHCASLIAVNLFSSARHVNYIMYKKNLNNRSRCIEFRLICAWLNRCTLTLPLSIALSATILLSWSFFLIYKPLESCNDTKRGAVCQRKGFMYKQSPFIPPLTKNILSLSQKLLEKTVKLVTSSASPFWINQT